MQLPINEIKQPVIEAWKQGGCIVSAPPGSGKTTQLPLWLLKQSDQTVYLLIPKRIAVMLAAKQLAANIGENVGQQIGYRLRHDAKISARTRLVVTTYGSFVRMLLNDASLLSNSTVILDEFHERSVDQDFCYALLHEYVELLDDSVKRIIMSATFNSQKLEAHSNLPTITAQGFSHTLSINYRKTSHNWISDLVALIQQLYHYSDHHLLVFLPGLREIRAVSTKLPAAIPTLTLHGQLNRTPDIQSLAEAQPTVILATNIAESSLTLPNVYTVIDSGYERYVNTDLTTGINQLLTRKISKASATQRSGRAARLGPGKVYRLWSEDEQNGLIDHQPPEIALTDISEHYLLALSWGTRPEELPWLDKPRQNRLLAAQTKLQQWHAIDQNNQLTDHGKAMLKTGLTPWIAHLLVSCADKAVLCAGLYLGAHLSLNQPVDYDPLSVKNSNHFDAAVKKEARKLAEKLNCSLTEPFRPMTEEALIHALPERLVRWQSETKGQLFNGTQCQSSQAMPAGSWMIYLEGIRQGASVLIQQWIPVSETSVFHAIAPKTETEFIAHHSQNDFRQITKVGEIKIREQRCSPNLEEKTSAWIKHIRKHGEMAFQWSGSSNQLKQRWLFAQQYEESWLNWPEGDRWTHITEPYFSTIQSLSQLNIADALIQHLGYDRQQRLSQLCPTSWQAPSGRSVAIHYDFSNQSITAQCKLQEAFGLKELPVICNQTLSLELTAPNGRTVAKVTDLKHFWDTIYPQVRKELRGRYAKHPWPENPLDFQATTKTNRQIRAQQ
jgi:ATP-dependent helicase HrpB